MCLCEVSEQGAHAHAQFTHHGKQAFVLEGPEFDYGSQLEPAKSQHRASKKDLHELNTLDAVNSSSLQKVVKSTGVETRPKHLTSSSETVLKSSIIRKSPFLIADQSTRDSSVMKEASDRSTVYDRNKSLKRNIGNVEKVAKGPGGASAVQFKEGILDEGTPSPRTRGGGLSYDKTEEPYGNIGAMQPSLQDEVGSGAYVSHEHTQSPGVMHRHHSASFHGLHHITEHLASAVGGGLHDYMRERTNEPGVDNRNEDITDTKHPVVFERPKLLDHTAEVLPITKTSSFVYAEGPISAYHPGQKHHHSSELIAPGSQRSVDSTSIEGSDRVPDIDSQSWHNNDTKKSLPDTQKTQGPRVRVSSPPPWLKNPQKQAGNAHIQLQQSTRKERDQKKADSTAIPASRHGATTIAKSPSLPKLSDSSDVTTQAKQLSFPPPENLSQTEKQTTLGTWPVATAQRESSWHERKDRAHTEAHQDRQWPPKLGGTNLEDISAEQTTSSLETKRAEALQTMQARSGLKRFEQTQTQNAVVRQNLATHELPPDIHGRFDQLRASLAEIEGQESTDASAVLSAHASELEAQRPTPRAIGVHSCEWKDKYAILATEIRSLRAELSSRSALQQSVAAVSTEHVAGVNGDDLGIEGVTIVMHFRGKEDLVINTDLG